MSAEYDAYLAELDEYATSNYADEEWGEVHLDGLPLPVVQFVNFNNLATFQPKFTVGETSKDSDNLFSVWVQDDWTGGGQMAILNDLSDVQRFRHATAETRFPYMLSLPLLTSSYTIASATGTAQPVGDYKPTTTTLFWAAFGVALRYWDVATKSFLGSATLAAEPVNKGVVYSGKLYIPEGLSGYDVWDGTTIVHSADAALLPVSFLIWDDKLLALSTSGQVSVYDDISLTWSSPLTLKLRGNQTPRNLVNWWDQSGNPTVYVVTDSDVWAVDPVVPTMYKTGLSFPHHPDQGLGSCAWRDDAMYVSVGTGVHQLARGNVVSAMGLDHNDGLPLSLRGTIVDLEPEYNGMFALVKGVATTTVGSDTTLGEYLNLPRIMDDQMVVPTSSSQANSTLQRWTGTGWHTVWQSAGASGNPSRCMVSQADGEYRVWWGYGTNMLTQPLRRTFYNPRDGAELGIDNFAASAYLQTGRFDAGMASFYKVGSHLEVHLDPQTGGTMQVRYQTDVTYPDWVILGTAKYAGSTNLYFNIDGYFSKGEPFKWIEFEYNLAGFTGYETPIMMWSTFKFVKVPLLTRSWSFTVPLGFEEWKGRGVREIADQLDNLAAGGHFITFKHRDRAYRVRVSQVQGNDAIGKDLRGQRQVNLIELGPASIEADNLFHTQGDLG